MADRAIIVVDIGKTLAKLTLWGSRGTPLARRTRPNRRTFEAGRAVLDAAGIEAWLAEVLAEFSGLADVGAIIPVAHGAAAAIVRDGALAMLPSDYEDCVDDDIRRDYDALRDSFAETGSPALPGGLNLGVQLFALGRRCPELFGAGASILLWPQYWSWRLSGVAASEVTSLGCHSDLWQPMHHQPSGLATRMGWAARLPPLRKAGDVLGTITAEWASRTGLPGDTSIHCGVHDSNAALIAARAFPEIAAGDSTVVSTGTWFVAMRTPEGERGLPALPEGRDCLVNVDVHGQPVPSSRWMGGREIETLIGDDAQQIDIKGDQPAIFRAVPDVVSDGAMLLPGFGGGAGPFPHHEGRWIREPESGVVRRAAICLYAAMVTNASLELIGASNAILVEGRFAKAEVFVRALASLRPGNSIYTANAQNDVSFGALRLVDPALAPSGSLTRVQPLEHDLAAYHVAWRREVKI